jgi:homoserine O-acetyltransferase/O-succinyltransferase
LTPGIRLESGRILAPITLVYELYGCLNADRSNLILVEHAWTGDAHLAGKRSEEETKPGWWDAIVGPGKLLDTDRYCVLCSNVIGSCYGSTGPASINPRTGKRYNLSFPVITVRDMVRAQELLITRLGIKRLLCCHGGQHGRHAGPGMGDPVSGSGRLCYCPGNHTAPLAPGHLTERSGPLGHF